MELKKLLEGGHWLYNDFNFPSNVWKSHMSNSYVWLETSEPLVIIGLCLGATVLGNTFVLHKFTHADLKTGFRRRR